jgi:hypothetical protein
MWKTVHGVVPVVQGQLLFLNYDVPDDLSGPSSQTQEAVGEGHM